MIEIFLTIKETAGRLKDRGYDVGIVEAYIKAGKVPYHFRGGEYLIPFPEAEPFFPRLYSDEEMKAMGAVEVKTDEAVGESKAPAEEKSKKAPKGTTKKPK